MHDNYGSALAAQPGKSQGRPYTNASSQLIVYSACPPFLCSRRPCPGAYTKTTVKALPKSGVTEYMPDNNPAERALRTIAITRKNFLFLGSDAGGERAAVIYTVLQSAKLNGLDPEAYLADVIDRMAKGHPINRLSELLPWNWKPYVQATPISEAA